MATYNVSNATQLKSVFNSAKGGDVIRLAPGNYGKFDVLYKKFAGNVTITSASDSKATFSGITVKHSANITFDKLNLDGSGGGYGFLGSNISNVKVTNSNFKDFGTGLKIYTASGVTVAKNYFTSMEIDAMIFGGLTNAAIQSNKYVEQGSRPGYTHKDFIQFFTGVDGKPAANGVKASQNVKIQGNQFFSRDGWTHGILILNEQKGTFHKNIVITDNYFKSSNLHGISAADTSVLEIRNNVLIKDGPNYPLINVTPNSTYVKILNNTAPSVPDVGNSTWTVANNKETAGKVWHWTNGLTGTKITNSGSAGAGSITAPADEPDVAPADDGSTDAPSGAPTVGSTTTGGASGDWLYGSSAAQTLVGQGGNDRLFGHGGNDVLRGGDGGDRLVGGEGADTLVGGRGGDMFVFKKVGESAPGVRDVIQAGDGAVAFEGAGNAGGDRIDLLEIDADAAVAGNQAFKFGGGGKGTISVVDLGTDTLVRGNVDADGTFEFELLIKDGSVKAAAYTAADFIL